MGGSSPFPVFLLIVTILLCFSNIIETCFSSEKQALMEFKKDLKDPSGRLSSWIDDVDCCQWEGVVCSNRSGRVIQLHLQNPGHIIKVHYAYYSYDVIADEPDFNAALSGNISHSLQNLTRLRYLDLSLNNFSGIPVPSFFGSLKSLRYLNLSGAVFQGLVPYELGNLSSLHTLSVGGEFGPPLRADNLQWLAGLSNLEHLDMSHVNLSTVSNWLEVISMIPSLVELHLYSCELIQISQLVDTNFSSLTILDLSKNYFQGIPIPTYFGYLKSLRYLDLSEAGFQGMVPYQLGNLSSLHILSVGGDLHHLQFDNLQWLPGLSNLEHLDMSYLNHSIASNWLEVVNVIFSLVEISCLLVTLYKFLNSPTPNFLQLS